MSLHATRRVRTLAFWKRFAVGDFPLPEQRPPPCPIEPVKAATQCLSETYGEDVDALVERLDRAHALDDQTFLWAFLLEAYHHEPTFRAQTDVAVARTWIAPPMTLTAPPTGKDLLAYYLLNPMSIPHATFVAHLRSEAARLLTRFKEWAPDLFVEMDRMFTPALTWAIDSDNVAVKQFLLLIGLFLTSVDYLPRYAREEITWEEEEAATGPPYDPCLAHFVEQDVPHHVLSIVRGHTTTLGHMVRECRASYLSLYQE